MIHEELITLNELSEFLKVCRSTIKNWLGWKYDGKYYKPDFPQPYKVGRQWRFRKEQILEWLDNQNSSSN